MNVTAKNQMKIEKNFFSLIKAHIIKNPSIFLFIFLFLIASLVSPVFLTRRNLFNILWSSSVLGIIAVGQTVLLITGNFDMSVAFIVGLSGIITVLLQINGASLMISVIGGLAAGIAIGILNGLIIILTNANAFLITLGTSSLVYAINLIFTQSKTWYIQNEAFLFLGRGRFLNSLHYSVILFFLIALIIQIILSYTVAGRYLYTIGCNVVSAKYSGIRVNFIKFAAYVFCGFCAGLAGLVMTARTGSTVANAGIGLEFDSLIVSVLGGTSLAGGKGGTLRTVIGVLILGVINNLLVLLNFQYEAQQIIKGLVFLSVVSIDGLLDAKK